MIGSFKARLHGAKLRISIWKPAIPCVKIRSEICQLRPVQRYLIQLNQVFQLLIPGFLQVYFYIMKINENLTFKKQKP